ncbi:hypothetical protein [Hymenobacter cheonanensis]|uniref:hypothetical protein n=1 Tax=Hymenobacter sp. CA2-7 TaxID=3063993 RepID=UPI00271342FB|nr:hypothetical protein [Hymenobacter sp. CA2-7]MDO7885436.1 hypothetical protein [Hymenobacter sp. CA2-7]
MSTLVHLRRVLPLLVLLLASLGAAAQTSSLPDPAAPTAAQRAERMSAYLADALRLNTRQAAKLRAAVEKRLESADMLGHLLFASSQAAFAAYENLDYSYYTTIGKLLTPSQFHLLMQLDEPVTPADMPVLVQRH